MGELTKKMLREWRESAQWIAKGKRPALSQRAVSLLAERILELIEVLERERKAPPR